jgi:hypothetical protein
LRAEWGDEKAENRNWDAEMLYFGQVLHRLPWKTKSDHVQSDLRCYFLLE